MDQCPNAVAVESSMYAQTCAWPDISFAVGMFSRYQSDQGMAHWVGVKKVLQYLRGTRNYRLSYRGSNQSEVIGCSDLDFYECLDTRKLTWGYISLLVGGP